MSWQDNDSMAGVMRGDDTGAPNFVRSLARLRRRNQAPSTADPDLTTSIGAGADGNGPNGSSVTSSNTHLTSAGTQENAIHEIETAPADMPTLAPQGGGNRFTRFLARLQGQAAPTPALGEKYTGPITPEEKTEAYYRSPWFRIQQGFAQLAGATGTPEQKERAMEMPMQERQMNLELQRLGNETAWRRSILSQREENFDERQRHNVAMENVAASRAAQAGMRIVVGADGNYHEIDPKSGSSRVISEGIENYVPGGQSASANPAGPVPDLAKLGVGATPQEIGDAVAKPNPSASTSSSVLAAPQKRGSTPYAPIYTNGVFFGVQDSKGKIWTGKEPDAAPTNQDERNALNNAYAAAQQAAKAAKDRAASKKSASDPLVKVVLGDGSEVWMPRSKASGMNAPTNQKKQAGKIVF